MKTEKLLKICCRCQRNIAALTSDEHIYEMDDNGRAYIVAGPGSADVFGRNFGRRLAEVFHDLSWIRNADEENGTSEFRIEEFYMYDRMYREWITAPLSDGKMLSLVELAYNDLREKLKKDFVSDSSISWRIGRCL